MTPRKALTNHLAGLSAEQSVARWYDRRGAKLRDTRWRGQSGEIDMILQHGEDVVFVEVKKSRDFHRAAQSLGRRQINRIVMAAGEYLDQHAMGSLTTTRFDVALVDGMGQIQVLENAFGVV